METLIPASRRAWSLFFWLVLGALGLGAFVELVLWISRGLTFHPHSSSLLTLGMLAGISLLVVIAARPEVGFSLFLLTFPLNNESIQLSFVTVSPPNVLLVAIAAGLIFRSMFAGRRVPPNTVFWPKVLLLGWFVGATVISALMVPNAEATGRFLVTRIGYALTFLVALALVTDTQKLKRTLQLMIWSATAAAMVTLFGAFFPYLFPLEVVRCNEPLLPVLNTPRCSAFNLSFHALGSWLLAALPAILASICFPRLLGISRRLAVGLTFLLIAGLIFAQVRGAWVALLLALPIILAFLGRPKNSGSLAIAAYFFSVGVIGFIAVFAIWNQLIQPIVAMRPENFRGRLDSYRIAAQIFGQHWLFGIGPLDERYLGLGSLGYSVLDNSFMVEIAASGILGAIPFLLLWLGGFHSCINAFDHSAVSEICQLGGILGMGVLFLLISVQAYVAVGEKTPWILLGLAAALARIQASATSEHSPPRGSLA